MAIQSPPPAQATPPEKQWAATGLTFEQFLKQFDGVHAEWHCGNVEVVVANNLTHQEIFMFLVRFFGMYFDLRPVGKLLIASFTMKISDDVPAREPDLMIVLNENRHRIQETFLQGPADIAIEIVLPESTDRDYGAKFREYEAAGVREYWLLDPLREQPTIYALNAQGRYQRVSPDVQGRIVSALLPVFALDPAMFWQEKLPAGMELVKLVQAMVREVSSPGS